MSAASSAHSILSASSAEPHRGGVLFVLTGIKDEAVSESDWRDWYDEHTNIVLNCEGNGGLMLRYRNADHSIKPHHDLNENLASRIGGSSPGDEVAKADWPFLAILRFSDSSWYASQAFADMPRSSKTLPPLPDGSMGSPFVSFFAGLRGYEILGEAWSPPTLVWPRYLISVQTSNTSAETFEEIDKAYTSLSSFCGTTRYRHDSSKLEFVEPGRIPDGLAPYHFDGDVAPELPASPPTCVIKQDAWEKLKQSGDASLRF